MDTKIFEAPVLEPTTQKFIDSLASRGGKPIYELSIADAREALEGSNDNLSKSFRPRRKISPSLADQAAKFQHGSSGRRIQPESSP